MFEGWTYNEKGELFRPDGTMCSRSPHKDTGYLEVKHQYKTYKQHRVVFFLHHGYWPAEVDHKDRDKLNNCPINLLDSTRSDNCLNRGLFSNNTSGVKGVVYDKSRSKWRALLTVNGTRMQEYFDDKESAISKRKELEELWLT
mgnify:CR=1 FL=1